jgi:phosphoenolpyruvate-protein phosphotransferase
MLQGTTVCPGVAIGPALVRDDELARVAAGRLSQGQVNDELNRFRAALEAARRQLLELKSKLEGKISTSDARIFDTHLAYLKDPIFITDVERLVIDEQMTLDAAIARVISDFDRVFKLVESEYLRERALDLRDVGIRVLRCLKTEGGEAPAVPAPAAAPAATAARYVLCAKDLSIVDMFSLGNERVEAIVTEELALTSHAAILARSMRIPTMMGVKGLLKTVKSQDALLVDATGGVLHVNPDERILAEYQQNAEVNEAVEEWVKEPTRTRDGTAVAALAAGGNHDDVERAAASRMDGIGLYRCELLFLFDRKEADEEALTKHFTRAVELAKGLPLTVRLLDVDSKAKLEILADPSKAPKPEANPALGVKSVRFLFQRPGLTRTILRAVLRAGAAGDVRVAIPFVQDVSDVRRVKEWLFDERQALRKAKVPHAQRMPIGAVVEVPSAALGAKDLYDEVDFLVVALDSLTQYMLAVDRENEELRSQFQTLHPVVLRAVRDMAAVADAQDRELMVYGEIATAPQGGQFHNLQLLLGVGIRRFGVAPVAFPVVKRALHDIDLRDVKKRASDALRCSTIGEVEQQLHGYH